MRLILALGLFLFTAHTVMGQQDSAVYKASKKMKSKVSRSSDLNSSWEKLERSISDNESKDKISEDYYNVAREFVKKGEYEKAELYFQKAIDQVLPNKKTNKNLCTYYRELAKVQEVLKKTTEANSNYKKAASCTNDEVFRQLNDNDAERLVSPPEQELKLLDKNEEILTKSGVSKEEQVQNYTQQADMNTRLNKPEVAIKNYNDALKVLDSTAEQSNEIKSNIADLLAKNNQFEEAIDLQQQVVAQAEGTFTKSQQLRKLSDIFFASNNIPEGLKALKESYNLSIEKGNLKEAEASLSALEKFYTQNGQDQEVLSLYRHFLAQLDSLVVKDSSLADNTLSRFSEEKIIRLEKEKALKDELLERKNMNNTILLISIALLLVLLLIIAKAWFSIRNRNKQIALQSLRREMNPHFLFNSLNSVNQFIASNNEREANKYLTSYSNLMRSTMENSNTNFVPLALELDQVKKYLELEKLRFSDKFDYEITVDPQLDEISVMVPNMIIQPNLENAIWHGLRYRDSKGKLSVRFVKEGKKTIVWIEDNGIGLTESKRIKTENQKLYESRGLKNVEERIRLLNELGSSKIIMEIEEKIDDEKGVLVKIEWEQ